MGYGRFKQKISPASEAALVAMRRLAPTMTFVGAVAEL
jgi:hypothetical protein